MMALTRQNLLPSVALHVEVRGSTCSKLHGVTRRPTVWLHPRKSRRDWCRVARPSRPIVGKKRTPGYVCVTGDSGSCVVTMEPRKKTGEKSVEEGTNRISVVV